MIEIAEGDLAGKKAVTFFSKGTNCDMQFSARQSIKTAFFVVDLDQIQHAFLLGGAAGGGVETYPFHRGDNGTYLYEHNADLNTVNYWNFGRPVSNPKTTLVPTGYQLITWTWPRGGEVAYACSDRGIGGRIGGKRLCEVVAFSRELNMAERSMVEGYLAAKWWPGLMEANAATLMLGKKGQVHFDASESSSFHFDVDGDATAVSQWDDLSGNNNHFTPGTTYGNNNGIHYGTVGTVAEKPVFDSGAVGSGIDLKLASRITNTRTVFIVTEIDRAENAFWLGDSPNNSYRFHRGGGGVYFNPAHSYIYKYGAVWVNGIKIAKPDVEYPEPAGGLSVYTISSSQNCEWSTLGQDRNISNRNGGKRVAELFTFSSELSDEDRIGIEKLLAEKWSPSEEYVDALIANAPVHVDASSASNFNYSGSDIVGWKNQGSGTDLVKPSTLYRDNNARTCNPGSYGYTNGVPAFLMGPHGSYIVSAH